VQLTRSLRILGGGVAVTTSLAGLFMGPALKDLIKRKPTEQAGVKTLSDALALCRSMRLAGWELVSFGQHLVYDKFAIYSCRNLWDTPGLAFKYGMGYCTQYNLALGQLLGRLGFEVEPVFALRIQSTVRPDWQMGHTWLRVTYGGETRDVCAGAAENEPGAVSFRPLTPVHAGYPVTLFFTHLGLIFYAGVLEWRALLSGRPLPSWMFERR
jgi:hypothetical protein